MFEFKKAERNLSEEKASVEQVVRDIVRNVQENGDRAILDYTSKFDGITLDAVRVPR